MKSETRISPKEGPGSEAYLRRPYVAKPITDLWWVKLDPGLFVVESASSFRP